MLIIWLADNPLSATFLILETSKKLKYWKWLFKKAPISNWIVIDKMPLP